MRKASGRPKKTILTYFNTFLQLCSISTSKRCAFRFRRILRDPQQPQNYSCLYQIVQLFACSFILKIVPMIGNKQQYGLYNVSISPIDHKCFFWKIAYLLIRHIMVIVSKKVVDYIEETGCNERCIEVIVLSHHRRMRKYILVTWELCDRRIFQNLRKASPISTIERIMMKHSTTMLS